MTGEDAGPTPESHVGKKDRQKKKSAHRASKNAPPTEAQLDAKRRKLLARIGVDPDTPPPLSDDHKSLTWPRIAWRDHPVRHLANWPESALLQRLATFGYDVSRERFDELSTELMGANHLLQQWSVKALTRGDQWDFFPEAAMTTLWHRWSPETSFVEDLSLRLLESSHLDWVPGELTDDAALFLVRWLQEAGKLLARMPEGDARFDAWVAIEDVAEQRLGLFIPDHWEQLVKADLDGMLGMRTLLGAAVEEPEWLYLHLANGLLESARKDEVLPILEEGVDPDYMPSATYFGHAGEILLTAGLAEAAEKFLKIGLPEIRTGTQWDLITGHLQAALDAQGKKTKLSTLLKKHPRPDLDEEDDDYVLPPEDEPNEQPAATEQEPITAASDPYRGVGRNDSCPCGSGKKFKKCHGKS
jgi:hypothetical protein